MTIFAASFFKNKLENGPIALPIAIGRLEHLAYKHFSNPATTYFLYMPAVYILYSPSCDQFYTGATTTETGSRLEKHLTRYYENNFTTKTQDWELFLEIECKTISQALKIEKHIKAMKSKKYILDLKRHPGISEKLILRYPAN